MLKRYSHLSIAFFLPIIIFTVAYLCAGVFSQHSLLVNDLFSQYSKFLSYYRNNIFENGVFYSFSKDIGGNMYGIFSYYLMSPFNLITFLFPPQLLEYSIALIMALKTGVTGLTFYLFLINQQKEFRFIAVVFSLFYSLSSCFVVWHYHIIWSDAFYLLPLVILGVNRILSNGKKFLFIVSFTTALIINYYMAYMIGIFVLLYFVYHVIASKDNSDILKKFLNMAISTLLCALLSAVITVPTIFSLLQGKINLNDTLGLSMGTRVFNPFALAPKLINSGYDSLGNVSAPFIYCGMSVFVMALAFFFLKNISIREKIATGFLLGFLSVSLIYGPLNLMFHMFNVPNSFPYRFVFLLVFVMVSTAYKAFIYRHDIKLKLFTPFLIAFVGAILMLVYIYPYEIPYINVVFSISLAVITALIIIFSRHKSWVVYLIIPMAITDMLFNTVGLVQKNYQSLGAEPVNSFYNSYVEDNLSFSSLDRHDFYRIDFPNDIYRDNDEFKYGINGFFNSFTSLPEQKSEFLKNEFIPLTQDTSFLHALFGIRYTLSDQGLSESMSAFRLIFTADKSVLNVQPHPDELAEFLYNSNEIEQGELEKLITSINKNTDQLVQSGSSITAELFAENENTVALTSIVFDEGWKVWVNGESVRTDSYVGGLLYFNLPKGESSIVMRYRPTGFTVSAIVSTATLLLILVYLFIRRRGRASLSSDD